MQEQRIQIIDEILFATLEEVKKDEDFNKENFHKLKNKIYGKFKIPKPYRSIELIERYNELTATGELEENLFLQKLLRKRGVRSLSGVTVISLLTKFWGCP